MKKYIVFLFGVLIVCAFIAVGMPEKADAEALAPHSASALLMEYESGEILYKNSAEVRRPIASMVKIMTLNIIFDSIKEGKLNYTDMVSVSNKAASTGGSQAFLDAGKSYNAEALIKSIIIASANDSCVAMAEHLMGSTEAFVSEMNKRAQKLGMTSTNYANCTGLPAPDAFSTAHDVALCMRELLSHKDYFRYSRIWMEDFVHPGGRVTQLTNTNRLIRSYNGCDGGKTGYTNESKHCIAATAVKNGMRLISVVMAGESSQDRFADAASMLNYGFANYESKVLLGAGSDLGEVKVSGGKEREVKAVAESDLRLFGKRGETEGEIKFEISETVKAPVKKGDRLGTAYIMDESGKIVSSVFVIAQSDVEKASLWDIIRRLKGE